MLVEEHGIPLSIVVSGANNHDVTQVEAVLEAVYKPKKKKHKERKEKIEENLCMDAGYVGSETKVKAKGYIPHIRPRGEERKEIERDPSFKPRRWIVEVGHSWFNRFRKLLVRYEKTTESFLALNYLAASTTTLRKIMVIYG